MRVNGILYGTADQILPNKSGTTYEQLMHIADWHPSLLSAAGIDYKDYIDDLTTFDGIDHWDGLSVDNPEDKYFEYRKNLYYTPLEPIIDAGYRSEWMKLFNTTGGFPDGYCCEQTGLGYVDGVNGTNMTKKGYGGRIFPDEFVELYNLETDLYEEVNVRVLHPVMVQELWNEMNEIESTAMDPVVADNNCPDPPHPIDPVIDIGIWIPWCDGY